MYKLNINIYIYTYYPTTHRHVSPYVVDSSLLLNELTKGSSARSFETAEVFREDMRREGFGSVR